jgi:hypothetical protein
MKRCFPKNLLVLLASCALAMAIQGQAWKEYVYAEDGFAITTPSEPAVQKDTRDTPMGPVESHNYVLDLGNDTGLAIDATDLKVGDAVDVKLVLEASKTGTVESLHGKILSEKEITLGPNPGIQFEMETDSQHLRMQYFFVKGKLFALVSMAPNGKPLSPETDRIFASFRLVGKSN